MWQDPIVEQIHKFRQEHARKFDFDLRAIFEDLKAQEDKSKRKIISLPIKRKFIEQEKSIEQSSDKQSKWAKITKRVKNDPLHLEGYSEQLKRDMKDFRDGFEFNHDQ